MVTEGLGIFIREKVNFDLSNELFGQQHIRIGPCMEF
ncbi:hypothetical protein LINPERPRIM_LOCUS6999 [Linum perenne]